MTKLLGLFLFQALCVAGSSQDLRFTEPFAIHVPARADLNVHWNAPTNKISANISVYRLLTRELSPQAMSNLMEACSLTAKDRANQGNEMIFKSPDGGRVLQIIPAAGFIHYRTTMNHSWTNLVKDVPSERQARKLTQKFLQKLDINVAEVEKRENGSEPNFNVFERGLTYFVKPKAIYNTEAREVRFKRAVDGIPFVGAGAGGDGDIEFGSHGIITGIHLTWRNIERDKNYRTVTPEAMVKSIRGGNAIQGMVPDTVGSIDWTMVKSVTIKKAEPCYYTGGDPFAPSDWLRPYAALWATVDTGHGNVDLEIDCPIIAETQSVEIKGK
jgi:hypothetical protein